MKTFIDFDDAPVVAIPVTAGFGESAVRECALIEGPQGWGEFSPPPDVDDATPWMTAAVEPGTVGWPDPVRGRIAVAARVPVVPPAEVSALVAGHGTASVIVGSADLADDIARVEAVRDALGPDGRIRCDARGAWDVERAAVAIPALERAAGHLEFVVEPCAKAMDLARLRASVDVPLADYSGDADILVLDPSALGGVRRALRVAERSGKTCVVTAGRETSIGLAAAAALAGALPELPYACTVSRPPWVTADVVSTGRALVPRDGHVPVAPMPPAPDVTLLERYAITDPATIARWRARITAAATTLGT